MLFSFPKLCRLLWNHEELVEKKLILMRHSNQDF
jgi:hypothetical protein